MLFSKKQQIEFIHGQNMEDMCLRIELIKKIINAYEQESLRAQMLYNSRL